MNPWPAVFSQSVFAGIFLAWLTTFDTGPFRHVALALVVAQALFVVGVLAEYFHELGKRRPVQAGDQVSVARPEGRVRRSGWRRRRDLLVGLEILLVIGAPVAGFAAAGTIDPSTGTDSIWVTSLGIVVACVATFLSVVFSSSLMDWFYVRPRRDGLVCLPPCWNPKDERWYRVTRTWIRHRMYADIAFVLLVPVIAALVVWNLGTNGSVGSWTLRGIGIAFTLAALATRYGWSRVRTGVDAVSRSGLTFQLGQTISWRLQDADRADVLDLQGGSALGLQFRFGVGRSKKRPPRDEYWTGTGAYVFDVSTKDATVLFAARRRDGALAESEKLPIDGLLRAGSVQRPRHVQYCGLKSLGGACRGLNPDCERDLDRK